MSSDRHFLRKKLIQACFYLNWHAKEKPAEPEFVLDYILDNYKKENKDYPFFENLFWALVKNSEEIKNLIKKFANEDISRISNVDKAILMTGIAEMKNMTSDMNAIMVIDEYLELTKEFSSSRSTGFINGILNAVKDDLSGKDY